MLLTLLLQSAAALPPAAPAQDAKPGAAQAESPQVGYDKGFYLRSKDGKDELRIGGLLQVRGRAFESDASSRDDDFDLQMMRLEIGGRFAQRWLFFIEPRFDEPGETLDEGWLGCELEQGSELRAGQIKVPLGMEEMQSRRWRDFVQKSLLAQFTPGLDRGVGWFLGSKTTPWQAGVSATNGTGGEEEDDAKELALRGVWRPWLGTDSVAAGLQLGLAASYGSGDGSLGGVKLVDETGSSFARLDDDTRLDGERLRLDAEAAWSWKRVEARVELLSVRQDLTDGVSADEAGVDGASFMFSHMLTRHTKTMHGFAADTPLDDAGAWQVLARWSHLSFDDGWTASGALDAASDPGSVDAFDLGVNWWAGPHTVVRLHATHTLYADPVEIDGELVEDEQALLLSWQLHF